MKLTTTILDGMDLRIAPSNFRADPYKRSTTGRGMLGSVHFMWPIATRTRRLTLYYKSLSHEQARNLIAVFGPATTHSKVLQVNHLDDSWFIPGSVRITARMSGTGIDVTLEMPARKFTSAS